MAEADARKMGRFLLLRDADGTRMAVSATALQVACATEDGETIVHLAGGKSLRLSEDLETVVRWFCH